MAKEIDLEKLNALGAQRIVILYYPLENAIQIVENDFSVFEALGMLEAAKSMITRDWLQDEDPD